MMKVYPKYKSSNIEWIGEMPEHWGTKRFKFLFDYLKGRNPKDLVPKKMGGNFYPYLSMEYLRGKETEIQYAEVSNDFILVNENDLLLLWDGSNAGEFILGKEGILSSTMVKIIIISNNDKNFFFYLSKAIERILKDQTKGMGIPHVEAQTLYNFLVPIMPLYEQQSIARYLEDRIQKIDTSIQKKQKLIELLKEERTAIINQAVTKGLNPDTPMKDSGIEWLGEVPEHWNVVGLTKYLESIVDYRGRTPPKVDSGVFLVTARNIKNGKIDYSLSEEYIHIEEYKKVMQRGLPIKGDVLFTTEAPLGEVANVDNEFIALAQRIIKFRANKDYLNNYFLKFWLMSYSFQSDLHRYATGSTALGIKASKLNYLKVVLPTLPEQQAIVDFIESENVKIDRTISRIEKERELLQEYRTSLISEVVTGKIDVREEILK